MRYIFRADSSFELGVGHVMRLSAIAEEVIDRGLPAVFVGDTGKVAWVEERLRHMGFNDIYNREGDFTPNPSTDILILDSYTLGTDAGFLSPRNWAFKVNVFDKHTPYYNSDLMIHPGILLDWNFNSHTKVLSGPDFVPIRKSIKKTNKFAHSRDSLEIVVVGGGTDYSGFVPKIVGILKQFDFPFIVNVFSNTLAHSVLDSRFRIFPNGKKLDEVADNSNLVFTTASTTSLEFIARGIPTAVACAVDNQNQYYEAISKCNVGSAIGRLDNGCWELDIEKIHELVFDTQKRTDLQNACYTFIDLKGSKRIIDAVTSFL